jgi:hypothetical protein
MADMESVYFDPYRNFKFISKPRVASFLMSRTKIAERQPKKSAGPITPVSCDRRANFI